MKQTHAKWIVAIVAIAMLVGINYTIYQREQLLAEGQIVLLKLIPVDPRSLMQGDYMALRFAIERKAFPDRADQDTRDGHLVIALDERAVGSFQRFAEAGEELAENEVRLQYRLRHGRPMFATNAFFFQEGEGKKYEVAQYGEFRVSPSGEALLNALRDKDLNVLGHNRP